ncbi:DUF58 domain-containing protein [Luteimonas kalidii]|uniref:DUF58 domain-containing protein n=1 Tax=Luteimonas kalidii TaxID=3042025 RepID=A0ABT6JY16_9GAMM|nr:DUF58 domain-containing protein [Luteimonas kalidii]MDH5835594.1 DUF58 domain-containing protein [Luteimonas kalidii]
MIAGSAPAGVDHGVVPTLAELIALRGVAFGRRPPRRARHGTSGPAPSPLRGRGMEYAESRGYTQGDDARHIDWRLTARSGRMHTKLFQAERQRLTLLVADTAPSLYFGTRVRFKSVQAARAGAVAAWAALRDGDRVAALRGSTREPLVPPAGGMRGVLRVLDALVRWYAAPPADDAGLAVALEHARRLLRPGSRLYVLADAGSIAEVPPAAWAALSQHHEVTVLLVEDRLERDPPTARLPFLVDGQRVEPDLGDPRQRQRWQAAFPGAVAAAVAALRARGVRADVLAADAPSHAWLPSSAGAGAWRA